MKLTFDEAVAEHRKMWNWIADNIEKLRLYGADMKGEYLKRFFSNELLTSNCFCCEYDRNFGRDNCEYCPIVWKQNFCTESEYDDFKGATANDNYAHAAKIAREIANLPARKKRKEE